LYYRELKSGWTSPTIYVNGTEYKTESFLPIDCNEDGKENILDLIALARLVKSGDKTEAELVYAASALLF